MIFAAGTRKRRAQLAVTKRATKRGDSTDDPEHEQGKAGLDVGNLKSKAGKYTGANNVRDYDPARRKKTDGSTGFAQTRAVWLGGSVHIGIDNGTCAPDWLLA